ncbi:S8 family serine peptidase [Chryseobacterium sp. C39-AII1]|uniref:S8 family serine peptidase n=1 Tax=Chryseobacterium sp. C39-AII1 TaxID=3080332 RepID=UPI00320B3BE8
MNYKSFFLLFAVKGSLLLSQKVKVGIWERFDVNSLRKNSVYTNTKESINAKDDDGNGYVDDIHGIGFNEFEKLVPETFVAHEGNQDDYDHGTAIASVILQQNPNVELYGAGFVYTTERLEKSGLLKLSAEERIKQLPHELERMDQFIQQSIDYFSKNKVQLVNISFGQTLEGIIEKNPNFGKNLEERTQNSQKWINSFKNSLEKNFKKHPEITFVVACGNDGKNIETSQDVPANIVLPNVIVVGGLDRDLKQRADFSNEGKNIDVYAPSEDIAVTMALNKKETVSGVSVAAPYITGKLSKLIVKNKVNKVNVKKILEQENSEH